MDALTYKADVPTRAKDWVSEKKNAVNSLVSGATARVSDSTPDHEQVKQQAGRIKVAAERNPLGLAIGGAALGFIAGLLAPSTRVEDQRLGETADQMKGKAAEAGQEALDRGKQVAQEAAQSAAETARQHAREQSRELSSAVQEKAKEAVSNPSVGGEDSGSSGPAAS
jgi:gas vesicle protein